MRGGRGEEGKEWDGHSELFASCLNDNIQL